MPTRKSVIVPGYDCIYAECTHDPKGKHGIHGDEWHYHLHADDDLTALCLSVYTSNFPDTIPESHWRDELPKSRPIEKQVRGSDLSLYARFPVGDGEGGDLDYLREGGGGFKIDLESEILAQFRPYSTALGANEFFAEHGDPHQFKQPESFWKALEAKFAAWDDRARTERIDTRYERCRACKGRGVTEKK